jgi:hypothetical protein
MSSANRSQHMKLRASFMFFAGNFLAQFPAEFCIFVWVAALLKSFRVAFIKKIRCPAKSIKNKLIFLCFAYLIDNQVFNKIIIDF